MQKMSRLTLWAAEVLAIVLVLSLPAVAADFPTKPITIVTGSGAGGAIDILSRILARHLEKEWGQSVIVNNKPGAGGMTAATLVKKEAPDGYTLLANNSSVFTTTWQLAEEQTYSVDDFTYVNSLTGSASAWVTRAEGPYKTLKDVWAAARSGKAVSFGSFAIDNKMLAEYVAKKEGVAIKTITLKSVPEILQAVLGGHVDFGISGGTHAQYVKKGVMRVLAVTGDSRVGDSPDVPTLKEMGYGVGDSVIFLVAGPKGMPADIVKKFADAIDKAMHTEEAIKYHESRESAALTIGSAALEQRIKEAAAEFAAVKKSLN
jgi:tripartite-type tricarboxylate transporter receptor subunit TctC